MQRAAVGGRRTRVDRRSVERMAETNVTAARRKGVPPSRRPPVLLLMRRSRRWRRSGGSARTAASRAVRAASGSAATRRVTSSRRLSGTGSGIPGSIDASDPSALAISRAKSGLPPAVAAMRRSTGGAKRVPTWRSISTIRASASSGPRDRAVVLLSPNALRNPSASTSSAGRRTVVTKPMRWPSMRRATKPSALAVAESSQPASSMTTSVGRRSASPVSTLHRAMPTARRVGVSPRPRLRAKHCDVERFLLDNRQPVAHLVDSLADQIGDSGERQTGLGLLTGTAQHAVAARVWAAAMTARTSAVLPMPASPSISRAPPACSATPSRNMAVTASSWSRLINRCDITGLSAYEERRTAAGCLRRVATATPRTAARLPADSGRKWVNP